MYHKMTEDEKKREIDALKNRREQIKKQVDEINNIDYRERSFEQNILCNSYFMINSEIYKLERTY
jgi:hypothetical protein